jgi:hypothetical protein
MIKIKDSGKDFRDKEEPDVDPQPPAEELAKHLGLVEVGSLQNDVALVEPVGTSDQEDDGRLALQFHPL